MKSALAAAILLLVPVCVAAQTAGTLTLKDGSVRLIRGITAFQGAEGVRLRSGDILETSDKGFAQVELRDGTVLALGPSTRLLIIAHGARADEFALMTGWLKGENNPSGGTARYVSLQLSASTADATVILHAAPAGSELYFESGTGKISSESALVTAKAGQFFSRRSGKKTVIASRPDGNFVAAMPVPFRDTLPQRIARFSKAVEPKADHEVSYADIDAWLHFGPWRQGFVERFSPRLDDPAFRSEIEKHLNELPGWDEALHPEKHENSSPTAGSEDGVPQRGGS